MSEQDFNDLHSAYPKEITQENFQSTINSLKESSKYVLNGANSKWITGLIELSKEMHRGIMDNSADSFNYSFEEIEEWQFETAAVIANEVCSKNFEGGTDNAILVLEVHFCNLDILYEFYPDFVIFNSISISWLALATSPSISSFMIVISVFSSAVPDNKSSKYP